MRILSFLLAFLLFLSPVYALEKKGHINYWIESYEDNFEFYSDYKLNSGEQFFLACDLPHEESHSAKREFSKTTPITLYGLRRSAEYVCHISVVDMTQRGRVVVSSGMFPLKTTPYRSETADHFIRQCKKQGNTQDTCHEQCMQNYFIKNISVCYETARSIFSEKTPVYQSSITPRFYVDDTKCEWIK